MSILKNIGSLFKNSAQEQPHLDEVRLSYTNVAGLTDISCLVLSSAARAHVDANPFSDIEHVRGGKPQREYIEALLNLGAVYHDPRGADKSGVPLGAKMLTDPKDDRRIINAHFNMGHLVSTTEEPDPVYVQRSEHTVHAGPLACIA